MKLRSHFVLSLMLILLSLFLTGCSIGKSGKSSADWAFSFVVWDGYIYKISDGYVVEISNEIGQVTKYSDMEGTYSENFSNKYVEGTKYYSIKGINPEAAIAVEEQDGKYRKALRQGKYGEK
ncbi:hypothetical protein [Peribacillus sp. SCS-155]|uniref:hypothetical protein n=1 Tax=Peribacillus sedimenti TaxID=3115297 RepID=UPI00390607C9